MERLQDRNGKVGTAEHTDSGLETPFTAEPRPVAGCLEDDLDGGPPLLRLHVIFEDPSTGARATRLVESLAAHLKLEADFIVSSSGFGDIAEEPQGALPREPDADPPDILVLSAHGQAPLPLAVIFSIRRWLNSRSGEPRALVISLDAQAEQTSWADQVGGYLDIGSSRSVEVFLHFGAFAEAQQGFSVADIHYRAETKTALLDETLQWTKPSSHWGINE
jgi:hypothetical protein